METDRLCGGVSGGGEINGAQQARERVRIVNAISMGDQGFAGMVDNKCPNCGSEGFEVPGGERTVRRPMDEGGPITHTKYKCRNSNCTGFWFSPPL